MKHPQQEKQSLVKSYTYLALGDSYTIGEQVPPKENFPNQVIALLKEKGFEFEKPEIIAQTGWTTDELQLAINKAPLSRSYDLVTLLIGVNNQYRGRSAAGYVPQFESLLKQAIAYANNNPDRVIVLSIPDWGVTPFAKARLPDGQGRDRKQVAGEIDEYNAANELAAKKLKVHYINVTPGSREAANDPSLLTSDGLHPSGKEYAKWAKEVVEMIKHELE